MNNITGSTGGVHQLVMNGFSAKHREKRSHHEKVLTRPVILLQIARRSTTMDTRGVASTTSLQSMLPALSQSTATWTPHLADGWSSSDVRTHPRTSTADGMSTALALGTSTGSSGLAMTTCSCWPTSSTINCEWTSGTSTEAESMLSTGTSKWMAKGTSTGCTCQTTRGRLQMDWENMTEHCSALRIMTTTSGMTTTVPRSGTQAGGSATAGLSYSMDCGTTPQRWSTGASHGMSGRRSSWWRSRWRSDQMDFDPVWPSSSGMHCLLTAPSSGHLNWLFFSVCVCVCFTSGLKGGFRWMVNRNWH